MKYNVAVGRGNGVPGRPVPRCSPEQLCYETVYMWEMERNEDLEKGQRQTNRGKAIEVEKGRRTEKNRNVGRNM